MPAKLIFLTTSYLTFYLLLIHIISRKTHTPFLKLLRFFLIGVITIIPLLFFVFSPYFGNSFALSSSFLFSYLLFAILEEIDKTIPLFHKKIYTFHITDYICIALGFAFIENILYSSNIQALKDILIVSFFRLTLDSSIHALSSSIVGFSYYILRKTVQNVSGILLYCISVIFGGLFHFSFNYLQVLDLHFLCIPFLTFSIYGFYYVYHKIQITHRFKALG